MKTRILIDKINQHPALYKRIGHYLPELRIYYLEEFETFYDSDDKECPDFFKMKKKDVEEIYKSSPVDMPFRVIAIEAKSPFFVCDKKYADDPGASQSIITFENFILIEYQPGQVEIIGNVLWDPRDGTPHKHTIMECSGENLENIRWFWDGKEHKIQLEGFWAMAIVAKITAQDALHRKHLKASENIPKTKIRVNTKDGLDFLKVKQIIRIYPKKLKEDLTPALGGHIDFTYRFEVEGHWRTIEGVGKDRAGVYQVIGKTWVKDFEKGPKDAPLIRKIRIKKKMQEELPVPT